MEILREDEERRGIVSGGSRGADEGRPADSCLESAVVMPRVGRIQRLILKKLSEHGCWRPSSNWVWMTKLETDRLLSALTAKGYVRRVGLEGPESYGVYEPLTYSPGTERRRKAKSKRLSDLAYMIAGRKKKIHGIRAQIITLEAEMIRIGRELENLE